MKKLELSSQEITYIINLLKHKAEILEQFPLKKNATSQEIDLFNKYNKRIEKALKLAEKLNNHLLGLEK
jgi:hypothetical protein